MSYHSDTLNGYATLGDGWQEVVANHRLICVDPECRNAKPTDYSGGRTIEPPAAPREAVATVKRIDLWGNVLDTFKTEGEANGWKPDQGRLL